MNDGKICGECKYHYHDNKTMLRGDYVCINPESDACGCYTCYDDECEEFEQRK